MKKRVVLSIVGLAATAMAGGCYQRVVRAEGLGAQGVTVQKPYRSETALDKAVFPEGKKEDSFGSSSTGIR
ncbi:MAG: hypothetical protein JSS51_11180 [Planctomycetes bacterium]|nr:hypothetical protein [Planctomycetota bacterium]